MQQVHLRNFLRICFQEMKDHLAVAVGIIEKKMSNNSNVRSKKSAAGSEQSIKGDLVSAKSVCRKSNIRK